MSRDAKVSACDGTAEPASSVLKILTFFSPKKKTVYMGPFRNSKLETVIIKSGE